MLKLSSSSMLSAALELERIRVVISASSRGAKVAMPSERTLDATKVDFRCR
jgi:hypothetical protein